MPPPDKPCTTFYLPVIIREAENHIVKEVFLYASNGIVTKITNSSFRNADAKFTEITLLNDNNYHL